VFGFESFLEGQEEVISRIVDGRSVLAVFPTGQGKSLCYQLSALHLPGLTLVVSPLVALMKDQVDFLIRVGISAARLDSSLTSQELDTVKRKLDTGKLKLLYVAPERFANERFIEKIRRLSISLMVIDEAHCISEWGHNFRPNYLKLARFVHAFRIPTVLALTATATPKVASNIQNVFGIQDDDYIYTGFYRPNLTLRFTPCDKHDSIEPLLERLKKRREASTIIYVTLQKTAEDIAETLNKHGFDAQAYHAGLDGETRHSVQEWFMQSSTSIVVATIAFGMGIDKPDIRYVYHYNLPKSLENYSQEIGRAGRDGKESVCELLGCSHDLTVLENFVYGDTPEPEAISMMVDDISGQDKEFSLSVYETSYQCDLRPLVVNTLLTYMELEDVIESTGPFYTSYKFTPLRSSQEILARFDSERAQFLKSMFSCAQKGRVWFTLEIDEVQKKLSTTRNRIVAALSYLEEQGDLELKVSGSRVGFRIKRRLTQEEAEAIKEKLVLRFQDREKNDIARLHQVLQLINHVGCRVNYLLNYFGEERSEDCGHCEYCLSTASGTSLPTLEEHRTTTISRSQEEQIKAIIEEQSESLVSIRQKARFLCGISSPKIVRAKLTRHPSFGVLGLIPFAYILKWLKGNDITEEIISFGSAVGGEPTLN